MNYRAALRPGSFLHQYLRYMTSLETPVAYDFWTGVWALGSLLCRTLIIDRPDTPIHMNWYVILVADTGLTRKSTAVRMGRRVLTEALDDLGLHRLMIESKSSGPGIDKAQVQHTREHGHSITHVCVSEMADVFGKGGAASSLVTLLTDLYDCPQSRAPTHYTSESGATKSNIGVSLLSASTPNWLHRYITPEVVEGGFTGRTLFVVTQRRKRAIPWPTGTGDTGALVEALVECHRSACAINTIELDQPAMRRFASWYRRRAISTDTYRATFEAREHDHVLRLAACLAINNSHTSITLGDLNWAIKIIIETKNTAAELFLTQGKTDRLSQGIERVRQRLLSAGLDGVDHSELAKNTRNMMTRETLEALMTVLHEAGLVQLFVPVEKRKGPKRRVWVRTEALTKPATLKAVLQQLSVGM